MSGYIFFGASHHIQYLIERRLYHLKRRIRLHPKTPKVTHILLDFTKCTGLDTSAFISTAEFVESLVKDGYKVSITFANEEYFK